MDNIFPNMNDSSCNFNAFVDIIQTLPDGDIVEFGTYVGTTAINFASRLPNRKIYTIDHFLGLEKSEKSIPPAYVPGAFSLKNSGNGQPKTREDILELFRPYNNIKQIYMDIHYLKEPEFYGIENIVACHIDADIYEPTVSALKFLDKCKWKSIIIRFDDWGGHHATGDDHEKLAFKEWIEKTGYDYNIECGGDAGRIWVNRA